MSGTLFVVATPLGNLDDLSARGAETLRQVPVVAAEDTRRTRRLLNHLEAKPRLVSVPAFAEQAKVEGIIAQLLEGVDVALVTDAGTPAVSDPGARLVSAALDHDITVVPIPGPTAVATAVSVSGFSGDRYLFLGFLPRKGPPRRELLQSAAAAPWTLVFYESPRRLGALLEDLGRELGSDRPAMVGRELTKLHEEIRRGTLDDLQAHFAGSEVKGEVTVVVEGRAPPASVPDPDLVASAAAELVAEGLPTKEIVRHLTEKWGLSRNEGYRLVMRLS